MDWSEYRDMLEEARQSEEYWSEVAINEFTEELAYLMEKHGINRSELAHRVKSKAPYITRVLQGNANFTIQTMNKFARVFGRVVHVHMAPEGKATYWWDETRRDYRDSRVKWTLNTNSLAQDQPQSHWSWGGKKKDTIDDRPMRSGAA